MAWSEWKKLGVTPLFYTIRKIYDVTTSGKTTVIGTLNVADYKTLNAYTTVMSTSNSGKGNVKFYDAESNLIAETGVIANQGHKDLENIDISNYDEIVMKIVGTGSASGNSAKTHLTVICY